MRIKTALVTRCSSFDHLKIVIYINVLRGSFERALDSSTYLTRVYVNTLTLCKTALLRPEK